METLPPISKRISLLLRKSHKRPHLSVGYFTKKKGVCQGLFLAGTVPRPDTFVLFYLLIHCRFCCFHRRYSMKRNLSALQEAVLA